MRTEKELWDVVLSRPDLFEHGLCNWVYQLYIEKLIDQEEYHYICDVLKSNLPPRRCSPFDDGSSYWYSFPYNEIRPRIDWIKKRIETL